MGDAKRTVVLFPGAWGNKNKKYVRWWFRHVIAFFSDWNVVILHYKGTSLKGYVNNAHIDLSLLPNGCYAIGFSMGAQVIRGVAAKQPGLFKKVALFGGMERRGIRIAVLIHGLMIAFAPLWRVLLGKDLELDTDEQIDAMLLGGTNPDRRATLREQIKRALHPEPCGAVRQISMPPLRLWMPPLPCEVMAIVPEKDFFVAHATYPDERVKVVRVAGDHSLIASESFHRVQPSLERIERWFSE